MSSTPDTFDVAVIGAGPAGAAGAGALCRRGASVVVIESRPRPAWRVGETLPPAARPLLNALGVLETFEADGHLPSHGNCSAWGSETLVETDFVFGPHGSGWQVDRERFDARLAEAARLDGADVWHGSKLTGTRRAADRWELTIRSAGQSREVRAKWLIDATGRRSAVARHLGARRAAADSLACVYGVAKPAASVQPSDVDARTLVEASPDGWWYTALVPGGRRTIAWLSDADLLQSSPRRDLAWFHSKVRETRHVASLLTRYGYELTGPLACTSANSSRADPWSGDGWIAVGDAAVAFDPLSSQGLLNALYTGLRGADAVTDALAGDTKAAAVYGGALSTIWAAYLSNLSDYYLIEQRWGGHLFWGRRHRGRT